MLVEVVGHCDVNVGPVDPDVLVTVTVTPGLLVLEAQGVEDLLLNDTKVNTTVVALNAEVVMLSRLRHKANAGFGCKRPQGGFNCLLLVDRLNIALCVGHHHQTIRGFLPFALSLPCDLLV